jgi:hypothetical protein
MASLLYIHTVKERERVKVEMYYNLQFLRVNCIVDLDSREDGITVSEAHNSLTAVVLTTNQ